MAYVFVPPPPSGKARRLSSKLGSAIDEFCRENPGTQATDIQQALDLVSSERGGKRKALLAVVVGLLLVGLGLALFFNKAAG